MQNFESRAAAVCALLCFGAVCFAQSVQAPTPPEIPTVNIPSVSAPTLSAPALSAPTFNSGTAQKQPQSNEQKKAQNSSAAAASGKLVSPSLSAADISMLSNLFGSGNPLSLNALGNTAAANAASLSASQGETAALLQAVLEKLDTLQKTVEQKSAAPSSPHEAANGGKILRFISGSYNILAGRRRQFFIDRRPYLPHGRRHLRRNLLHAF